MDCDLSTLKGVMEEVVEMTGINKKHNPSDEKDYTPRTDLPKKLESKPAEPIRKEKTPTCCTTSKLYLSGLQDIPVGMFGKKLGTHGILSKISPFFFSSVFVCVCVCACVCVCPSILISFLLLFISFS
jgi:hypothetical protein